MKHKNKNNSAKNLNKKEIKMAYFVGILNIAHTDLFRTIKQDKVPNKNGPRYN
jgi:hypothetical protein